jgi:hypothetical protein
MGLYPTAGQLVNNGYNTGPASPCTMSTIYGPASPCTMSTIYGPASPCTMSTIYGPASPYTMSTIQVRPVHV